MMETPEDQAPDIQTPPSPPAQEAPEQTDQMVQQSIQQAEAALKEADQMLVEAENLINQVAEEKDEEEAEEQEGRGLKCTWVSKYWCYLVS